MEEDKAAMTKDLASPKMSKAAREKSEDILICVDVDAETKVEMKNLGPNGMPLNRLECAKQAIIHFMQDKLAINPDHRFALATLSKSVDWLKKEFTSDAESFVASLKGLSAAKSSGQADLTFLFQAAAQEAITSRAQNRILRVILIYCRSSMRPTHNWKINQKQFTFDVLYLHDKRGPDNCPQDVFDTLSDIVDHVSEYEGYMFETSQGLAQAVFKRMSKLLPYPAKRCAQIDLPKSPAKKPAVSFDKTASKSKKEVKPLDETPNTNKKRIHSLGEEKAPDTKNYDEKIVGSRIKVWWPLDKAYYKGVVKSYDSTKKKHLVCYDDGDKENLDMRKHTWYFLKKSSEHAESNQTGWDEEAFTMPQKKKIKTIKEQSTSKQSKMDIQPETPSPIPLYVKRDDEVPQLPRRPAEQVLSTCTSQLKKYQTEAVKSPSVSLDKHSNELDTICEEAVNALKQEEVVANEKKDRQAPGEAAVKACFFLPETSTDLQDKPKAAEVSTPEQTYVPKTIQNLEHSSIPLPHDSTVSAPSTSIKNGHEALSLGREKVAESEKKTHERKTLEMVQPPVDGEEYPAETETRKRKRARDESCIVHKVNGDMEMTAPEGEPSYLPNKSSAETGDLQPQKLPQPCSVTLQLAKVKQSIIDTLATVRTFRSELETKEQSIVDTLSTVRKFRSEMEEKEDNLEASLMEIDVLGEKILGINKILNS